MNRLTKSLTGSRFRRAALPVAARHGQRGLSSRSARRSKSNDLEQFFEELRETHGFQPDISQEAVLVKRFRQRLSEQKK